MRHVTIRQALQQVADNPEIATDDLLSLPVHELVSRTLFEIANTGSRTVREQQRANNARGIILNRLVGRRRTGSHPATKTEDAMKLDDLLGGELQA